MPPPLLFDVSKIDLSQVRLSQEQIYGYLPQRFEFMLLDGVCHWDDEAKQIVAFRDIKPDDWWARGHVPGQPLLPGVLMLEMSAQTSALLVKLSGSHEDFIAFGGVDHCKFREMVVAPARLYLLAVGIDLRSRRIVSDTQGVVNGNLVFEARITGLRL